MPMRTPVVAHPTRQSEASSEVQAVSERMEKSPSRVEPEAPGGRKRSRGGGTRKGAARRWARALELSADRESVLTGRRGWGRRPAPPGGPAGGRPVTQAPRVARGGAGGGGAPGRAPARQPPGG